MAGLIQIGQSALRAAYTQLQTAGHNISNANTPGYVRQEVMLGTAAGQYRGGGYIGNGVNVLDVRRNYDRFMSEEVTRNTSLAAGDKVRAQTLSQVDELLADTDNGIGVAMDEFRASIGDMVSSTADPAIREVVLARAGALSRKISETAERLETIGGDLDRRIADSTSYVNQRLGQIATLNQQISEGLANGHEPNDLMDQRDVLINEVATRLQVTRDDQADGTVDLYTAGGMSLVVSNRAATLVTQQSASNPVRSEVAVELDGQNLPLTESTLGSGEIVGLLRMRDSDVHAAEARLGQLAAAFAGAFNKQQAMGLDMAGNVGKPMFSVADARARASATNTGSATVQLAVQDSSKLKATDYELSFRNGTYSLRNTVDGQVRDLGPQLPAEIDGLKIEVNGTMASGDVFRLQTATAFATSMRSTLASGRELATASPLSVSMNRDNAGSVKLVNMTQQQTSPDMGQPVTIEFTGADKFSVTGQGTGNPVDQTYVPGQPIQFNGWSLTLNGTPAIGDKVEMRKITPNARDNGNANAMVLLADRPLVDGANFNEAFGSLLSDMGARTLAAKNADSGSKALLESSKTALSNRSGVNLDEEAARLLQYRQAYQAAAKVIQTADEMFSTILSLAR